MNLMQLLKNDKPVVKTDPIELLRKFWEAPMTVFDKSAFPAIDISENEKEVTIKAEIPGMTEKDIDLSYQEGVLTISGEKKDEKEETEKNTYYKESYYGYFSRSIPLGDKYDWDKVAASYKNGALTVSVPKKEGVKENKVKINIDA